MLIFEALIILEIAGDWDMQRDGLLCGIKEVGIELSKHRQQESEKGDYVWSIVYYVPGPAMPHLILSVTQGSSVRIVTSWGMRELLGAPSSYWGPGQVKE